MINEYIERVEHSINCAINENTKLPGSIFNISGMSSPENRILLNELIKDNDNYLEIGVHKGSTFVSAMFGNNAKGVAIDNFSQFGGPEIEVMFKQNCDDHKLSNWNFINHDCFDLNDEHKSLISNINVYFYDGDHIAEAQEKALTYYIDFMANDFILIVDDWNFGPAEEGTKSGLEKTNLKIHKEWILRHGSPNEFKSWHNGLYIAVVSK